MMIDLGHTVEHGLVTYKGLPAPVVCDYLSREASRGHYAPGTEFQIGRIEMVANTGTYVDSPFHRYADRKDLYFQMNSRRRLRATPFSFRLSYDTLCICIRVGCEADKCRAISMF